MYIDRCQVGQVVSLPDGKWATLKIRQYGSSGFCEKVVKVKLNKFCKNIIQEYDCMDMKS